MIGESSSKWRNFVGSVVWIDCMTRNKRGGGIKIASVKGSGMENTVKLDEMTLRDSQTAKLSKYHKNIKCESTYTQPQN